MKNQSEAVAYANIALIKYWGKRNEQLKLPTKSSLSVTLDALQTLTTVDFCDVDRVIINGNEIKGEGLSKFTNFLDKFRSYFGINEYFLIKSSNNFPTAAGLASSASGFAALAKALNDLCKLNLDNIELSKLARFGSGSASRSVYGGFVLWHKGLKSDGSDSFAEQVLDSSCWPEFRIIVVVVDSGKKGMSSSEAMQVTVKTSNVYNDWIIRSEARLSKMIEAISQKNIEIVGNLAEIDCLEMHETMRQSVPAINYLSDKTLRIMDFVKSLRKLGVQCYFTIDAGPNVKIITEACNESIILSELKNIDGIEQVIVSKVA